MIQTIGVIGGGQLGRMLALDAKRMGYSVVTLDPQERSPCGQVSDQQIVARYDDLDAVEELGRIADVVTYEFENIAIESVRYLEKRGFVVTPSSAVLRVTQDRLLEKRFVRDCAIGTTDFAEIAAPGDLERAAGIGFPGVLKTSRGGYDGKGQWRVADAAQARAALEAAGGAPLIYERLVDFERELSVVATRDAGNNVITYPVCENEHRDGILAITIAPARVDAAVAARARALAAKLGERLGIVGTYCVEFFLTAGELLVNEIAPRPHNSGHYTMDAARCSQYEEHVRAICDLPLATPYLFSNAVMVNILGSGTGDRLEGIPELLSDSSIVLHLYGKKHAVAGRKMGHFTMLVDEPVDATSLNRARAARALLRWVQ